MATLHLNPMYYLKHAWDATHSAWGKTAIVLFYLFIWCQIVWAATFIIFPSMGFECFFSTPSDYETYLFRMMMRTFNVLAIGFFLYADRGGIKVWNVMMVFVIYGACTWIWISGSRKSFSMHGAPKTCDLQMSEIVLWSTVGWSVLALLCAFMESRRSQVSQVSQGERTPLV